MEFNPIQTNAMPLRDKILNMVWLAVNDTLFRFTPPVLRMFKIYRVGLTRLFGAKIAWNCYLHPKTKIEYPWNLTMGCLSSLGENSWVYAMDKVSIGEKCCIGKDVHLLTGTHDIVKSTFDLVIKPITIGDCSWIATRSTVLPGIMIGKYNVVAANSVVTKNTDDCVVGGGNPAKFIKKRVLK